MPIVRRQWGATDNEAQKLYLEDYKSFRVKCLWELKLEEKRA
jgi:hypothetical protein